MAASDMSAEGGAALGDTIIHRKVRAGVHEHQVRAMSLLKALRLTTAKIADDLYDMSMAVIGARSETRLSESLPEVFDGSALLILLDGPDRRRGAAILDPGLVGALIQQQTMSKVLPLKDNGDRMLTQTDAAICAPFLNALLQKASVLPDSARDRSLIAGFAFGARVEDARLLTMALEEPEYELVHLDLDIASGVRQGHMMLCMPKSGTASQMHSAPAPDPGGALPSAPPLASLSQTVMKLPAPLRVTLAQLRMPLHRLSALDVGSIVDIGAPKFDRVRVQTLDGVTLTRGVLGQVEGQRVVQVQNGAAALSGIASGAATGTGAFTSAGDDVSISPFGEPEGLPEVGDIYGDPAQEGLPDMSELPDFPDLPDLPEGPDLTELPELDNLADLPDLPDFDSDAELPQFNIG